MAFSRSLLLKGLAGAAAVGAVGGGVGIAFREEIGYLFNGNKRVNRRLGSLGIEGDCLLRDDEDSSNFSKECDLDEGKLKKIKFSNKGEGDLKVVGQVPQELKLKIDGSNGGISFSFRGITTSSPIAIVGDKSKGKIVIKNEEQKFKDVNGRLTKDSEGVDADLKAKLEELNKQLEKVNAPAECRFDEAEADTSTECSVTEDDLKGIKFSGLEEGEVKVKGEVSTGLKLKVDREQENSLSLSFAELSGSLTIFIDQREGEVVVIKNDKKFKVGEDGKLEGVSSVVDSDLKEKLKEFNKQLGAVKAPLQCRFEVEEQETTVDCSISQEELKKLEFSNKETKKDLNIVGEVSNDLKLKVERNEKVDISLSFPQQTSEIKIFGREDGGKIILNKDKKFKVVNEKLTKENSKTEINELNKQLGNLKAPFDCRFDEAEEEESLECTVTQDQFKKLGFSNKGDGTLTVNTWPASGTVKLKVEKKAENAMSISFPGLVTTSTSPVTIYGKGGKIVVKSEEQKFTVVDGKLTKESSGVDANLKPKLKEFNEKLEEVKVPIECRFDEAESDTSVECDVNKDNLLTMAFTEIESDLLSLNEKDFSGMKLKIEIVKKSDSDEDKELILTFKDNKNTVKIMSEIGEKEEEEVSFVKGTNPEFVIGKAASDDDKEEIEDEDEGGSVLLVKKWDPEKFKNLLGLSCDKVESKWECMFTGNPEKINVGKGTGDEFGELDVSKSKGKNFDLYENVENFNQGFKFVFMGETITGSGDSGVSIEQNGKYEVKWKSETGKARTVYLVKKEGS